MNYDIDPDAYYTDDHEWARLDDGTATIGIADYAQDELGDLVFFELPAVGDHLTQGDQFAVVESIKAVSDVYAPLSGEVTALNDQLHDAPELPNEDPYGEGWLVKIAVDDPDELATLFDAETYETELLEQ